MTDFVIRSRFLTLQQWQQTNPGEINSRRRRGGGSRPVRVQELVRVMVAPLPPSRPITHTSLIPGILTPLPHPPSNHTAVARGLGRARVS